MPPLYVDGVLIESVFVNGDEQDSVFANGVEVFTRLKFEDYRDDFLRDGNGTPIANHLMNTGQSWDVVRNSPSQAVIGPVQGLGSGQGSTINEATGVPLGQRLDPIVDDINPMFVCECNFSWQNSITLLMQAYLYLDRDSSTYVRLQGVVGSYDWVISVNGVIVHSESFPIEDLADAQIIMYYDGTDIQAEITGTNASDGSRRLVSPRIPASPTSNLGRSFALDLQPYLAGAISRLHIYDITETGYRPEDIPWP